MRSRTNKLAALLLAGILVAAACGGDDDGGTAAPNGNDTGNGDTEQPTPDEPAEIDRSGRFAGLDDFCEPADGEPDEAPQATDPGITADEVHVAHVRVRLEELEGLGFAVDIGDPADQAETFARVINEECGGIHGRQLVLHTVEMGAPGITSDADADAQRVCITVAEDRNAIAAFSFSGAGGPLLGCLTGANEVLFITTYSVTETDLEQSQGRLFSVNHAPSDVMTYAVRHLADELQGQRIGVVHQDATGEPQIVQQGLLDALDDAGLDVVRVDVLGCNNSSNCNDGVIPSVQGMIADDVDVIFPLLNTISLPGYLAEMVTQGVQPGDFDFFQVAFLAQDGELVSGKIVEFGGDEAGALYDGATVIAAQSAGRHRTDGFEPDEFSEMCNRTYAEHSDAIDAPYDVTDDIDNARYGATNQNCTGIRMIARALDAAGPNPTRAEFHQAFLDLGGVDLSQGTPGSFRAGKQTAPDVIVRQTFRYPCPVEVNNRAGHCMVPDGDRMPIPRG